MLEIEMRFRLIDEVLEGSALDICKVEVGMLHIRQLTEVVAVACLVAQGDYKTQRAFKKEYSPGTIFKALKTHYPRFFPQPVTPSIAGGILKLVANTKPDACSELELVAMWNHAGTVLHRASLNSYLMRSYGPPPSPSRVKTARDRLWALLEHHAVRIESETERETILLESDDIKLHHILSF